MSGVHSRPDTRRDEFDPLTIKALHVANVQIELKVRLPSHDPDQQRDKSVRMSSLALKPSDCRLEILHSLFELFVGHVRTLISHSRPDLERGPIAARRRA